MSSQTEQVIATPSEAAMVGGVARAASIIAIGSLMSRVLGFALEILIPHYFGASGAVSVFRIAETWSQTLYDFLVGGLVSAAMVPLFGEYAARRQELWRILSVVLTVFACLLALVVLVVEVFAGPLVEVLGPGYDPGLQALALQMLRLVLPAVFFLGIAGILTAALYALRRFAFPAFTTAAYNACVILAAWLLAPPLGILSLGVGILLGALSQVVLQLPGLRDARLRPAFEWRHPALRQLLRLYLPVVGGTAVALVGVTIDRNLASRTGEQSIAWMQQATVLVQFPIGLVAAAISLAILPNLSATRDPAVFRRTLASGLKLVLLLILPAVVGLLFLAPQLVGLLFEHGKFTPDDTLHTGNALRLYALGLAFAAVDQPLVFAFYARKNTLTPNLVAFVGVGTYLVVALLLLQPLGYLGLVLANSAQLTAHALVMIWLTQTRLGGLRGEGLSRTVLKMGSAAVLMGAAIVAALWLPLDGGGWNKLFQVVIPGGLALVIYFGALKLLRVRELELLWGILRRRRAS